jgi:DNA-binding NtrC family response regulator
MRNNNILLVDDDTSCLHLFSILLESKGFAVTIATNGNIALEILAKYGFGMLITDYNMPGMNGIELSIKVKEQYPDIYILMITADITSYLVEAAANAGISQIISKPINISKLLPIIRSSLRMR